MKGLTDQSFDVQHTAVLGPLHKLNRWIGFDETANYSWQVQRQILQRRIVCYPGGNWKLEVYSDTRQTPEEPDSSIWQRIRSRSRKFMWSHFFYLWTCFSDFFNYPKTPKTYIQWRAMRWLPVFPRFHLWLCKCISLYHFLQSGWWSRFHRFEPPLWTITLCSSSIQSVHRFSTSGRWDCWVSLLLCSGDQHGLPLTESSSPEAAGSPLQLKKNSRCHGTSFSDSGLLSDRQTGRQTDIVISGTL